MTQSIHLLLEVPAFLGTEIQTAHEGNTGDLRKLLAKARLRVVPSAPYQAKQVEAFNPPKPVQVQSNDETLDSPVKSLEAVERDYIVEILARSGGNRTKAAQMLNISRRTLQRKLSQFHLDDLLISINCG